ncbi:Heterodimeric efflux ABC transporter, permease/ATP-binding subunit 1 [hydrothermal vent metagenome]|uniref:Heterodimeric efflux ABC transporter, permease/ATP-binding subunit 1 n=1 Tax=hydrothermal vent metagenome TaxID=652676 RepID=A0A3B0SHW8_9ZZZZ
MALLLRLLSSYRAIAFVSIFGALIWMATIITIPYLVGIVIDRSVAASDPSVVWLVLAGMLLAGAIQAVGISLRRYFGFKLSYRAEADVRNRIFAHIQRMAFSFHDVTSTGELMARASSDLSQLRLILAMLPITLANIVMFLVVSVVLVVIDPVLGLVSSLMVPALLFASARFANRVVGYSFDLQQRLSELSHVVEETVSGIEVVKSYGQEAQQQAKLDHKAEIIYDSAMGMAKERAIHRPFFEIIPALGTVAVLAVGGIRVVDGAITIGEFVAFTQYLAVMVLPLMITGWFFANLPRSAAAASRIDRLLETAPEIHDPKHPVDLKPGPGEITIDNVSFTYPDGTEVLNGVSVTIPGGTSVGIVGATGAGKSTLAHLIPRFYDVSKGAILIDGVDVRDMRLDQLRSEVSVVFQETFLFSSTIADNVRVGHPMASNEQVRAAARLARAHDFICAMSEGYDTVVGERGATLSGGQRQRVSLARGVVRDPRILVLDDATSSVDALVEAEIQEALRQVMSGRTTVIVAHRTSTLAIVDNVAFIEGGELVAFGPHESLLRDVPRYGEVLAATEEGVGR